MSEPLPSPNRDGSIGRLGRYALLQSLAKGGMAQVYVAQKDGAREVCVLKQLLLELEEHEIAGKRFHREAHVASFLNHPNIARIMDAGFEDDTFCIAFEFIAGKDGESMMHRLLSEGRMLPYEVSIAFGLGVLQGLAYAHEAKDPEGRKLGLVHRDLSPRNMMLSYSGDVKIIDFGLAHGRMGDFKTAPGMVLGTLRYVSPEQALTDPIDRRSDLYSLSVVLQEMLTGRWVVQPGKPFEVLKSVISDVPPTVTELNPHLPAALGPVIAKGMAKAPEDRWQTAGEYLEALKNAAGQLAKTEKTVLGDFVSELFPEDTRRARALVELGQRRFEARMRGPSLAVVRPTDLSDPEASDGLTRTGYMDQTALAEVGLVEPMEYTRTAGVGDQTRLSPQDLTLIAPRYPGDAAETLTAIREFSDPEPQDLTSTAVPTVVAQEDGQTFVLDRTLANPAVQVRYRTVLGQPDATIPARRSSAATYVVVAVASGLTLAVLGLGLTWLRGASEPEAVVTPVLEPRKEPRPSVILGVEPEPPTLAARSAPEPPAEPTPTEAEPTPRPAARASSPVKAAPAPAKAPASASKAKPSESAPAAQKQASDGGASRLQRMIDKADLNDKGEPTREAAVAILEALKEAARSNLPADRASVVEHSAAAAIQFGTPSRRRLAGLVRQYQEELQKHR